MQMSMPASERCLKSREDLGGVKTLFLERRAATYHVLAELAQVFNRYLDYERGRGYCKRARDRLSL